MGRYRMFFEHSSPSLREITIYSNYKDITSQSWKDLGKQSQRTAVLKLLAQEQCR